MNRPRIAIVGLGPTGSFAARAAYDMKCEVDIYVSGTSGMSTPPGAFWLHWIPEDMTHVVPATKIYVIGQGTADAYIKRQWGTNKGISSSFPTSPVWETGYDPQKILQHLVPSQCEEIRIPYPMSDSDIADLAKGYDLVFQTFPTAESKRHQPALIEFVAAANFNSVPSEKNWVAYNGTKEGIWVRDAALFGHRFLEFPKNIPQQAVVEQHSFEGSGWKLITLKDLDPYTKPWLQTLDSKVKLVGRMAMWDRKFLSHDAYNYVQKQVQRLG